MFSTLIIVYSDTILNDGEKKSNEEKMSYIKLLVKKELINKKMLLND